MKTTTITYIRLGRDDEWMLGVQETDRLGIYHYAVVRDGVILLQGKFDILPGEDIHARIEMAVREWKKRPRSWHTLFHRATRVISGKSPLLSECKGKCPWMAPRAEFRDIVYTWSWIVPKELRQQGSMLFREWRKAPSSVQSAE